jgi:hypothetical protein
MTKLKEMNLIHSFLIYIPSAILMYVLSIYLIPFLSETTEIEIIFFWFVVAGLGVFLPLTLLGLFILKKENITIS